VCSRFVWNELLISSLDANSMSLSSIDSISRKGESFEKLLHRVFVGSSRRNDEI
jgi:hypothetical protein